jgi:hypothetical protein
MRTRKQAIRPGRGEYFIWADMEYLRTRSRAMLLEAMPTAIAVMDRGSAANFVILVTQGAR